VDPCTLAPPQASPTGNGFGFGLKTPEIISLHPQKNFAQNTKWSLHGNFQCAHCNSSVASAKGMDLHI